MLRYLVAYEVGRAVNPALVEGQLRGGVAQGIGGRCWRSSATTRPAQPQAVTFIDLPMPPAAEVRRWTCWWPSSPHRATRSA